MFLYSDTNLKYRLQIREDGSSKKNSGKVL